MKVIKQSPIKSTLSLLALALASSTTMAQELSITVTNLTQGLHFTPVITAAHTSDNHLFMASEMASVELQTMAEGGDISGLVSMLTNSDANINENPAAGLLAPAMSASFNLTNDSANTHLSLAAMILPSNDGFVGLDSWKIPEEAGTYTVFLNAYDAGTEANDEIRGSGAPGEAGMPVPPPLDASIGMNGTGITDMESNNKVHIHRGSLGDDDMTAGKSDINNSVQRWLNPVAKLTITVQ
ncbi:spondin domain-containing protein [Colwellia psychrerythraea]|uniref:Spondin domain-containing protein n=1 Tax=Colwellia psychrerythraea TaxID=28229 RepID=A0A099KZA5_COLPS|nr:spondin domain-containing protein [Colwellia psychrerythraea]KGJ94978.1 Spondin domain-containing protein [Colwellia psychrerythraea]